VSTQWKPKAWIAILLGVVLQSFTFLYLNRAKWFWVYFILICAVSIIDWKLETYLTMAFSVICPIHAYRLVKGYEMHRKRAWFSKWWGISGIIALIFITIFSVRSFLYEPFQVPSASMAPSLNRGDYIVVKKLGFGTYGTYGFKVINTHLSKPDLMKRGEVYAFYAPNQVPYVKRLMAIPGDTLVIRDNRVFINGVALERKELNESEGSMVYQESYDDKSYLIQNVKSDRSSDFEEIVVPKGSYFFMGDNRDNSSDSRYWGFVSGDDIIGQVVYVFSG
jgi:signal peptidase I